MEIKEIQNLIKFVAKSGAHEVKLETDDFKITIKQIRMPRLLKHQPHYKLYQVWWYRHHNQLFYQKKQKHPKN